ncbi:hypothetical protein AURDEDRAFT_180435 [Auricularia subglabra TFB-10046 SS5]|nr:hypothetical protein AURDEDRAFT_180435 [Auricularia subglabra TFB-10046 SS5]
MDVRHMSFQQALPHLSRLADDGNVRQAVVRIRDEQRALERSLADQRAALVRAQHNKAEGERKMATITGGSGLTQWHAQARAGQEPKWFNTKFEKELLKFDKEQVLKAWDALVAKQQAELEKLGVPTMFVTEVQADREKQQRVVQVLEGIFGLTDE